MVEVEIIEDGRYEKEENFQVILSDATGGATFDGDGGPERCIARVNIESDENTRNQVDALAASLNFNVDRYMLGANNWADQFTDAVAIDGDASFGSKVGWALALPWKLAFAVTPPVTYLGGWLCFVVGLGLIGALTALIGDLVRTPVTLIVTLTALIGDLVRTAAPRAPPVSPVTSVTSVTPCPPVSPLSTPPAQR